MQSIQMSVTGKVMSGKSKLNSFQMTFYMGPISFVALIPFAFSLEAHELSRVLLTQPRETLAFLLGSCCLAVAYNIVIFQSLKTLSSVGTVVLGNVKIVLLIALTAMLLGELQSWTTVQIVGCVAPFGGSALYSFLRWQARQQPQALHVH